MTLPFKQLRGISLAIKNSSTIILPKWYEVLEPLSLKPRMMPRDVSTLERSGLVRVSQEGTGWLAKADGIGKG